MRQTVNQQRSLVILSQEHAHVAELEAMGKILDANPEAATWIHADLVAGVKNPKAGREGMSGEQVLRALMIKQMTGFSYERLSFHLGDSIAYQSFCCLGIGAKAPTAATLQRNFKRIEAATLERIHWALIGEAQTLGVERGRKVRIDTTVIEANIHDPLDSALLFDSVRVLAREMHKVDDLCITPFRDRTRVSKRRSLNILNAKNGDERNGYYRELIVHTEATIEAATRRVAYLESHPPIDLMEALRAAAASAQLKHFSGLAERVVDQTRRRVLGGEKVPATQKIVSIFEEHTDIIVKDRRETHFGHKFALATGASGLVLDCVVLDGNPADSSIAVEMVDRQAKLFGRPPRQVAFDGGFTSKQNLADIKERGVEDVMFSKRRGLEIADMVKSTWVYKRLRDFRAGVESGISFLKRVFGLDRCTWRSLRSFHAYSWASVVSANLLVLARHVIASSTS